MEANSLRTTFLKVLQALSEMGTAQDSVTRTAAAVLAEQNAPGQNIRNRFGRG
jgi:hypothetical protein